MSFTITESALLVPPGDVQALAEAVRCLHNDRVLGQRLAARAYAEVRAHYTWQQRARLILDQFAADGPD